MPDPVAGESVRTASEQAQRAGPISWGSSGRRFKSCPRYHVMSQDIGIALNLLWVQSFFRVVAWGSRVGLVWGRRERGSKAASPSAV